MYFYFRPLKGSASLVEKLVFWMPSDRPLLLPPSAAWIRRVFGKEAGQRLPGRENVISVLEEVGALLE
jgi:hypothetical protein